MAEPERHRMIDAVAAVIAEDGVLQPRELLLLRGIADRLDVLIPSSIEMLEVDTPGTSLDV
jgi:hypothetical protein